MLGGVWLVGRESGLTIPSLTILTSYALGEGSLAAGCRQPINSADREKESIVNTNSNASLALLCRLP